MRILLTTGRLLAAHWPALFALGFLGVAVRGAAYWGALEISNWQPFVAQVLLLVLPLGLLVPVIAMLRVCYPSLPNLARPRTDGTVPAIFGKNSGFGAPAPDTAVPWTPGAAPSSYAAPVQEDRPRGRLADVALSVLVPFLTIYVVEGMADADHAQWVNDASYNEFTSNFGSDDLDFIGRIGLLDGWTLAAVVLGLVLLRWLFGVIESKVQFLALALLGAALEAFWSIQTAYDAERLTTAVTNALESRVLFDWGVETYQTVTEEGQGATVAEIGGTVVEGAGTVLASLDEVLVAPLGWLAIGTVVLGRALMAPPSTTHPWLDQMSIPAGLRAVLAAIVDELRNRFSALWQGLRMIVRGGVGSMLAFCLAYLVVMRAPVGVAWLVRTITGPVDTQLWIYVISPWEEAVGTAVALALAGPLIAAAVDTIAARGLTAEADPEGEISDGEGALPGAVVRS